MSEHIQSLSGGRQPPESALWGLTPPAQSEQHERTPGVARESEAFDFRLIIWVGIGLGITALLVSIAVGWVLGGLEHRNTIPSSTVSELAREEASKPFGRRLESVPGPHLEGIERESSLLEIRTEEGEKGRFWTAVDIHVRIDKNDKARLFELREGQRVTLTYFMPGGAGGGLGVVTSVTSPPTEAERKKVEPELPEVSRTMNGEIIRIEPRGIAAARAWAEAQMGSYGWIDRDKEIVHIPIEKAIEQALRSKEFGSRPSRERKRPEVGRRQR